MCKEINKLEVIKEVRGNDLCFARGNETVILPTKESHNAGYDIYANFEEDYMIIDCHETKKIPTNLYSACSEDYYIQLVERGSTGTKGIGQRCGVVDSSYRGAWFVPITNHNDYKPLFIIKEDKLNELKEGLIEENKTMLQNTETSIEDHVTFYSYEKALCQAVIIPVPKMEVMEISLDNLKHLTTERGETCLGSSGK